jgi:hypothetical protein
VDPREITKIKDFLFPGTTPDVHRDSTPQYFYKELFYLFGIANIADVSGFSK